MATQVINEQALKEFEIGSSRTFMLRDILPGPAWAPYGAEDVSFAEESDCQSDSRMKDGSCLKGFVAAVGLEAAMVIGLYGIWQALHVFRWCK